MPLFQKAVDLDNEFLPARVALAAALVNMGRTDEAMSLFSESLFAECGDAITSYAPALINLAAASNVQLPSGGSGEKGPIGAFKGYMDAREYYYAPERRRAEIRSTWDPTRLSGMKAGLDHNSKWAQSSFDRARANPENSLSSEIYSRFGIERGLPTAVIESKFKAESAFKPNLEPHRAIQSNYGERLGELKNINTGGGPQGVIVRRETSSVSNSPTLRMCEADRDRVEFAKAKTPILDLMITTGGE